MIKFISVLLIGGLIALSTYLGIGLVKRVREILQNRKKAKSEKKEIENENGRNSCS